jgi:hypothetical protein
VLAFGDDSALKRAFEPFGIKDYTIHSFAKKHLEGPGTQRALLYDAVVRALVRELPLRRIRRRSQHFLVVGGKLAEEPKLQPLVKVAKQIFGKIPNSTFSWAEALAIRLESTPNQLWLLLEPTVLGSKPDDNHTAEDRQRRKDFIRERQATRYNKQWNTLLKAWIDVLSGGNDKWTVKSFGLTEGIDASFEISSTTGFSRRYYA